MRRRLLPALALAVAVVAAGATAAVLRAPGRHETPVAVSPAAAVVPAMVDGRDYFTGTNVPAGVYRQRTPTIACEWTVTDPITGDVIERSLAGAPGPVTVNLADAVRFRSSGCGAWLPA